MKRLILSLCLVLLPAVALAAQEKPRTQEKPEPQERSKPAPEASRPAPMGQIANVKVDLTITEQAGAAAAQTKSVSVVAADGNTGRIRSYNPGGAAKVGELNVDVRPLILQGGRVQVALIVEYRPTQGSTDSITPGLSESMTVYLQEGKPLVVSQSADPNSDRKVMLEVRATVLR